MAEIERETGVPAPTLYQWAARGGWRLCDLVDESPQPVIPDAKGDPGPTALGSDFFLSSGTSVPSVLAPGETSSPSRAERLGRPCDAFGVGETGPVPPEVLRASGNAAFAAAVKLAASGNNKAAREQLLLGQRFMAAAGVAPGAKTEPAEFDGLDPREELKDRLLRLIPREVAKYLKAIEDGQEEAYLEGRHVRGSEEWKLDFWWPHLMAAREAHPPFGFINENEPDAPEERGFLNIFLRLLMADPNRPDFLKS